MTILRFCVVAEYGIIRRQTRGESPDVVPSINGWSMWGINEWITSCPTRARCVLVLLIVRLIVTAMDKDVL